MMRLYIFIFLFVIPSCSLLSQKIDKENRSIIIEAKSYFFYNSYGSQIDKNVFQDSLKTGNYYLTSKDTINGGVKIQLRDKKQSTLKTEQQFPDLKLKDINNNIIILGNNDSSFITFWGITCRPCIEELISINKIAEQYSNICFIAISSDSEEDVCHFLQNGKYSLDNIKLITDYPYTKKFNIASIPFSLILDKKGIIRKIVHGKNLNEIHSYFNTIGKLKNNRTLL